MDRRREDDMAKNLDPSDGGHGGIMLTGVKLEQGGFTLGPISLELTPGSIHGLLGPNGAGKTTLIRAVLGVQKRSAGRINILGVEQDGRNPEILRQIGVLPDDPRQLLEELSAQEFWSLTARVYGGESRLDECMSRAFELADHLAFEPPRGAISSFSLGMRKKTQLVASLLHDPRLIILDEPRNGLDPLGIDRMESLLVNRREAGCTLLVASHDLRWAQRVADTVHILNEGKLCASGSPESMMSTDETSLVDTFFRLVGNGA